MIKHILINCDLGEWETSEKTASLMDHIHLANIACGGHAGSKETIQYCDSLARQKGVLTGAHPGIMGNKGRTLPMGFTHEDFVHLIENQIQFYLDAGAYLHHIKLHGALYHLSEQDTSIRNTLLDYVASHDTKIVCLAGGAVARAAQDRNLPILQEAFLDRNYLPDGQLVPRDSDNAHIHDLDQIKARIEKLDQKGTLEDVDGNPLPVTVDTLCIHSDSPNSQEMARIAINALT
ncbi:UPF0271 protein [Rubritalea squalenifaciens DSM 18772]|uniref:UPF0271 protein n=2 Tax=Rubritalea TaxID=361050 RepID=A0A1M6E0W4_9BACT|nr:LamB/YcsF family protein [Rubritalea squalenifaciens]SHI79043.1 UPF0271 protein [Rubritalea squalenifaciens DSM 18772]